MKDNINYNDMGKKNSEIGEKKEYKNKFINQFLDRCKSFPRKKITLIEDNLLKVYTEKSFEGYAWIGASEHNIENGCKGVKCYNYMLIDSTELYIYFNEREDV
jgi:hypothetical protein